MNAAGRAVPLTCGRAAAPTATGPPVLLGWAAGCGSAVYSCTADATAPQPALLCAATINCLLAILV